MQRIVWTDDFSLGIEHLDAQHRQLIDLINRTSEKLESGGEELEALPLLRELQQYARSHFEAEEAYMTELEFPEEPEHIKQHQYFISRIMEMDARLFNQEDGILLELGEFLNFWLIDHIVMNDFKYASFAGTRTKPVLMT